MVIPFTGFPNKAAAHIALETVRKWLEINADKVSILAWLKCKGSVLYMTLYLALCALLGLVSKLSSLPSVFACLQYFKKTPWCMQQSKSESSEGPELLFVTLWLPLLWSFTYCLSVDAVVHHLQVDRVIFCVFLNVDYKIYQRLLYYYFPPETPDESEGTSHVEKLRVGSSVLIVYWSPWIGGGSPSPRNDGKQKSDEVPTTEHSASEPGMNWVVGDSNVHYCQLTPPQPINDGIFFCSLSNFKWLSAWYKWKPTHA